MHTTRPVPVLAATGVFVIAAAVAVATQASASASRPAVEHIVLVDHTGPTSFDDVHPAGLSVGDTFAFSETVSRHGKVVGSAGGVCVEIAVRARSTSQQCTLTAVLHRGELVASGIATYPNSGRANPVHYAITGGTGEFRRARGQVRVTPIKAGSDRIELDVVTS